MHHLEYVGAYDLTDERETEMMDTRWRIFEFFHQIPNNDMEEIPTCSKSIYDLVMLS